MFIIYIFLFYNKNLKIINIIKIYTYFFKHIFLISHNLSLVISLFEININNTIKIISLNVIFFKNQKTLKEFFINN